MDKVTFEKKLPLVLETIKVCVDNEMSNNYDFNFNSYKDLEEKEFDYDAFECFSKYVEAVSYIENNPIEYFSSFESRYKGWLNDIMKALKDFSSGGYRLAESDDEDWITADEIPFTTREEMKEFIKYIEDIQNS